MVTTIFFLDLDDALAKPHGSQVQLIAVVASVGPVKSRYSLDLYCTRETCLMDSRLVFF